MNESLLQELISVLGPGLAPEVQGHDGIHGLELLGHTTNRDSRTKVDAKVAAHFRGRESLRPPARASRSGLISQR